MLLIAPFDSFSLQLSITRLVKRQTQFVHVCDKVVKLFLVNCQLVLKETVIYIFSCFLWNTMIKDLFCKFPPLLKPQLPSSVWSADSMPQYSTFSLSGKERSHWANMKCGHSRAFLGALLPVNGDLCQTLSGLFRSYFCFYFLKKKRLYRGALHWISTLIWFCTLLGIRWKLEWGEAW